MGRPRPADDPEPRTHDRTGETQDGLGLFMTKGVGKPLIMAVALLLWWVVAGSCAEQPPDAESASGTAIPTATPTRRVTNQKYAKPAARQAVRSQPTSKPEARKARQVTDSMLSSLPSSVSFEISSFASQGGRQLQPAPGLYRRVPGKCRAPATCLRPCRLRFRPCPAGMWRRRQHLRLCLLL